MEKIMATPSPRKATLRDRLLFATPALWPTWPFLPVIRHKDGGGYDCGLMCDANVLFGVTGYSSSVFLCNLFLVPPTADEFLALPKEVFDTAEEVAAAGWVCD